MELAPPSYESATQVDVWKLISPYISHPRYLCAASLVCRRWHQVFSSHLWGNPASHFREHEDRGRRAIHKLVRLVPKARSVMRRLVHTLCVPSSKESEEDLVTSSWLADVLHLLPNLQSLIVRELPFLDHQSLRTLSTRAKQTSLNGQVKSFNIRLTDASRCQNVTSQSLTEAMPLFANILYLDLSFIPSVREGRVLDALGILHGLQILKLRGVGLRDDDVARLVQAVKLRLRSLDVRDNRISDQGAKALLRACLPPGDPEHDRSAQPRSANFYRNEDFESYILHAFTTNFADRLWIEDATAHGITHLYISGNSLTTSCVNEIVKASRLHVLDVGNLAKEYPAEPMYRSKFVSRPPDLEQLPSILLEHAAPTLTLLRIDQALVSAIVNSDLRSKFVLPNMRTLILTGVPASATTPGTANAIVEFIRLCAAESHKARTQALNDYALPPGQRGNNAALKHATERRFALQRIVLEIASERSPSARNQNVQDGRTTLSMTEDRDSEAFWEASGTDFSFFEDCENARSHLSGKTSSVAPSEVPTAPLCDTAAIVAAFRKERKLAFENRQAVSSGDNLLMTEGFWDGVVQVVRNAQSHSDEMNGYLGSRFRG